MLNRLIKWRLDRQKQILDKHIGWRGFNHLTSAEPVDGGRAVIIEFRAGAQYRVPAKLLRACYVTSEDDHPFVAENKRPDHRADDPRILATQLFEDHRCVRVFFDDGQALDVAWDVILMSCEPDYQHFGGFTDYSKELTASWHEKAGPFRVED